MKSQLFLAGGRGPKNQTPAIHHPTFDKERKFV